MLTKNLLKVMALILIVLFMGCGSGGPTEPDNGGNNNPGPDPYPPPAAPTNFTAQRITEGVLFNWEVPDPVNTEICRLYLVWNGMSSHGYSCDFPPTVTQACDTTTPLGYLEYRIFAFNLMGSLSEETTTSIYVFPLITDLIEPLEWEGYVMSDPWGQCGMLTFQIAADSSLVGTMNARLWGLTGSQCPTFPVTGVWNGNTSVQINIPAAIDTSGSGYGSEGWWEVYPSSFSVQMTYMDEMEAEFTLSGRVFYNGYWENSYHTYTTICNSY